MQRISDCRRLTLIAVPLSQTPLPPRNRRRNWAAAVWFIDPCSSWTSLANSYSTLRARARTIVNIDGFHFDQSEETSITPREWPVLGSSMGGEEDNQSGTLGA